MAAAAFFQAMFIQDHQTSRTKKNTLLSIRSSHTEVSGQMLVSAKYNINTMKITNSEHSAKLSSPAGDSPPARLTQNFVECAGCPIFIQFILYFADTGMCPDTSANFFPVAAFSNGVFCPWPYVSEANACQRSYYWIRFDKVNP